MTPTAITPETRQALRHSILLQCEGASARGLTKATVTVGVRASGLQVSQDDVDREIKYLEDKKHLETVEPEISPEIWRARITAGGRDWLAKEGY